MTKSQETQKTPRKVSEPPPLPTPTHQASTSNLDHSPPIIEFSQRTHHLLTSPIRLDRLKESSTAGPTNITLSNPCTYTKPVGESDSLSCRVSLTHSTFDKTQESQCSSFHHQHSSANDSVIFIENVAKCPSPENFNETDISLTIPDMGTILENFGIKLNNLEEVDIKNYSWLNFHLVEDSSSTNSPSISQRIRTLRRKCREKSTNPVVEKY